MRVNVHKIELSGYCVKTDERPLILGTAGSYGNEQIHVTLGEGWQGLTVVVYIQPCDMNILLPKDGLLNIPWEATAKPLNSVQGRFTFQGIEDGRVVNTVDVAYIVVGHSRTEATPLPDSPETVEQIVAQVKTDADRADAAAGRAEDAAGRAGNSAAEAAKSEKAAAQSEASAARSAELAQQAAAEKGWMYLDDQNDSGHLWLTVSDNMTDVTLRDNGAGRLEAVYV